MINQQDLLGNTALNSAIERGNLDAVLLLLNRGADMTVKNKNHLAAIHQCIITNQPKLLEMILTDYPQTDINLGGENGMGALHYCAYGNNLDCAKILLKHNVQVCQPCNNGFYPIHIAAQNSSNAVLELLFEHGSKLGCSRLNMISYLDGDNNKPYVFLISLINL